MTVIDNAPAGTRERALVRRLQVLALRHRGLSYRRIARRLGVDPATVYRDLLRSMLSVLHNEGKAGARKRDLARRLELERLDLLWLAVMPRAGRGDPQAIAAALKIMERRSKYLGLDAPAHFMTETTLKRPVPDLSDEALQEIAASANGGDRQGNPPKTRQPMPVRSLTPEPKW